LKSIINQTRLPDLVVFSISEMQPINDTIANLPFKVIVKCTVDSKNMAENRNICAKSIPSDIDVISFFDVDDYMHRRRLEVIEHAFMVPTTDIFIHNYNYIAYEQKSDEEWGSVVGDVIHCKLVEKTEITGHVGHLSVRKSLFDLFNFREDAEYSFSSDMEYVKDMQKRGYTLVQTDEKLCLNLYCWWTGDNSMSPSRSHCLRSLINTNLRVVLITTENISDYIHSLHPGYQYLSEMHKGDYLKAYFMHFYGGAYSDIKFVIDDWSECARVFRNDKNTWVMGYNESDDVAYNPDITVHQTLLTNREKLVGNCAYLCKPNTPLTQEWYGAVIRLLDDNLSVLKQYPAKHPTDYNSNDSKYPFRWGQLSGEIFHPLVLKYNKHVSNVLPMYLKNIPYR
jgi:hypothetical protein